MRALIIDDDDDIRMLIEISLSKVAQWEVRSQASGFDVVDVAVAYEPDVVLLDLMMPGIDGIDTLALLKADERTRDIPVIFLTAKVTSQDIAQLQREQVLGVLRKPFSPMQLPDDVRELLAQSVSVSGKQ